MKTFNYTTHSKQVLGDMHTPVSIYLKVRDMYPQSALMESSDYHAGENSLSFIALCPLANIGVNSGIVTANYPDNSRTEEPLTKTFTVEKAMNRFINQFQVTGENKNVCGLYGYFSNQRFSSSLKLRLLTETNADNMILTSQYFHKPGQHSRQIPAQRVNHRHAERSAESRQNDGRNDQHRQSVTVGRNILLRPRTADPAEKQFGAVQRRDRQQVEKRQHQIADDKIQQKQLQQAGYPGKKIEYQPGRKCQRQVGGNAGAGNNQHVAGKFLQPVKTDRNRFGPAEQKAGAAPEQKQRQKNRTERVDMIKLV